MGAEIVVTIDPKLTGSGYAIGRGTRLLACGAARVPRSMRDLEGRIEHQTKLIGKHLVQLGVPCVARYLTVVGEFPVVYPRGAHASDIDLDVVDHNDLVRLAGLVCGIAAGLQPCRLLLPEPRSWKGTIPKGKHHARLQKNHPNVIPMVERAAPPSLQHDVWDAVGLFYWYTERCAEE